MYVVVIWLIAWSFGFSFSAIILRDLRTRGDRLSSSDGEFGCGDACVGCAVHVGIGGSQIAQYDGRK